MKRETPVTVPTDDGSPTLYLPALDEHYHSVRGAVAESMHVYIKTGLEACGRETVDLFECGFGTGLNAFLTLLAAGQSRRHIHYTVVEAFPLDAAQAIGLAYPETIQPGSRPLFEQLHRCEWEREVAITPCFTLHKIETDLTRHPLGDERYDVIYYDAFAPEKQPEMWSESIFRTLYDHLAPGGILTTYCAKGEIRRRLQSIGFTVERLPSPPHGKREILRASKPNGPTHK